MTSPELIAANRQEHIGRLFLRAHRDFSERSYQKLQARGHTGLSIRHTALLAHLDIEGTNIKMLAERAGMTKQAMGELVDDLVEKAYIAKETDPHDKRSVLIKFTERGWQFLEDAYHIKKEISADYATLLGDAGLAQLEQLLHRLLGAGQVNLAAE
jgi:DNA-binding MarR family transcriptional regulator